jgi:hypothetical protein
MLFDPQRALDILLDGKAAVSRIKQLAEFSPDDRSMN